MSVLRKFSNAVDAKIGNFFYFLGSKIARKPKLTILLGFLFVAACVSGVVKFEAESRSEKLWVPVDSEAVKNQGVVTSWFPSNTRSNSAYITSKVEGGNVLTYDALNELLALENKLKAVTAEASRQGNASKTWTWTELCATRCLMSSVLDTWKDNAGNFNTAQFTADKNSIPTKIHAQMQSWEVDLTTGGTVRDGSNIVQSARALRLTFNLKNNQYVEKGRYVDPPADAWEEAAVKVIQATSFQHIKVVSNTQWGNSNESGNAIRSDIAFVGISIMLIVFYLLINLGNCNKIESRVSLAVGGLVSVGCSLGIAYGLGSLCSPSTPVHSVLPFLIMGIGVDDIFVLVNEYDLTAPKKGEGKKTIETRLAQAMKEAGSSITVTTLTDFLAFLISSATVLPALSSFCIWAAIAVMGCFILTCTMFAGFLVLDAKRQDRELPDCCCCCGPAKPRTKEMGRCARGGCMKDFITDKYTPLFQNNYFRAAVLLGFLGIAGGGASQLVDIKQNFRREWFIPSDSYLQDWYSINKEEFSHLGAPVEVYIQSMDPHAAASRSLFQATKAMLAANKHINSQFPVSDWYSDFDTYMTTKGTPISGTTKANFDADLKAYLAGAGARHSSDVVWSTGNPAHLQIARQRAYFKATTTATQELNAMDAILADTEKLRESKGLTKTQLFSFGFTFPSWYQYAVIPKEAIQNIGLTLMAVFVIVLIFIASPSMAFLVTAVVGLVLVDILGFMIVWDVDLNGVSVVNLVLSVGLSVDYSAHIGHAFMHKQGTRVERAQKAVSQMGLSVINGAVSTFLAVCLLGLSKSYVFVVLFKMFFLTCVFGAFHGLLFFPILLSLVGPGAFPETHSDAAVKPDVEKGGKEMVEVTPEPEGQKCDSTDLSADSHEVSGAAVPAEVVSAAEQDRPL